MRRVRVVTIFMAASLLFLNGFADAKPKAKAKVVVGGDKKVKIIYPRNTRLQFDGLNIEGELKNPGEFYFQHRRQEKFDSLLDRRKEFHRELLRDVVQSR